MAAATTPLDDRGIEDVRELAIAQDNITWLALSVFLAAEVILFGFALSVPERILRLLAVVTGLFINAGSLAISVRSHEYLRDYWTMLRGTSRRHFDVQIQGLK